MARKAKKTGPKPEILKLEGPWKDAVKQALSRGKPPATKATKKKAKKRT